MHFTQYFPLSTGPILLSISCYFCQCTQAQIPFDCMLGAGLPVLPVLASIRFRHTAHLQQHYANHLPDVLIWAYLSLSTPTSARDRQHFSLLSAAWIIHLQLLTVNERLAPFLPQCRSSHQLAKVPVRNSSTSTSTTVTPAPSR